MWNWVVAATELPTWQQAVVAAAATVLTGLVVRALWKGLASVSRRAMKAVAENLKDEVAEIALAVVDQRLAATTATRDAQFAEISHRLAAMEAAAADAKSGALTEIVDIMRNIRVIHVGDVATIMTPPLKPAHDPGG